MTDPVVSPSGVPYTIEALRSLTDAELENAIRHSNHSIVGGDILDEAARRRGDRQARLLVGLTIAIAIMTAAVVVLTIVLVARG